MALKAKILLCKAILGRGQPGLMRWILLWIMPLVQDRLLDLLTSSPECYHCKKDVPNNFWYSFFCALKKLYVARNYLTQTNVYSPPSCGLRSKRDFRVRVMISPTGTERTYGLPTQRIRIIHPPYQIQMSPCKHLPGSTTDVSLHR